MLHALRRRAGAGAGGPLQQSEQLPACRPPPRRRAAQERAERRDLRRPVEQPRQPARPTTSRPARRSGSRPTARSMRFICSVGTGGTLAGTSTFLREMKKDIVIGCADPRGAAMYNLFAHGEAKATEGGSITEGIGLGRVTPIIEDIKCEKAYLIPDEEAVPYHLRSARARGALPRRLVGDQHRGRGPAREGPGPGQDDRDAAVRLRHALPVEAVQSGIPALEELAGAGMAGAQVEHQAAVRVRENCMPTDCLFREDAYLTSTPATVRRRSARRAASWSTAPASTRPRAGSRATAACW